MTQPVNKKVTLTEALALANGDRELIQQAVLAHAQAETPNDKIAVSQDTYDKLIASKLMAQLDALGIGTVKFRVQVEGLVQSGVRRDDAFKQILDMYVTVDPLLGQIEGIETDAQFIEDWQNSEYARPRGFTGYADFNQWPASRIHIGLLSGDELREQATQVLQDYRDSGVDVDRIIDAWLSARS